MDAIGGTLTGYKRVTLPRQSSGNGDVDTEVDSTSNIQSALKSLVIFDRYVPVSAPLYEGVQA